MNNTSKFIPISLKTGTLKFNISKLKNTAKKDFNTVNEEIKQRSIQIREKKK